MDSTDATVIPYHKSNRGRTVTSAKAPAKVAKAPARKQAAGRKAFQGEYCEIHFGDGALRDSKGEIIFDEDGFPKNPGKGCSKFSHLRTDGLGKHRAPFYRRILVSLTRTIKPLFIISFAAGSLFLVYHFVGGALHFNNTLPGSADSGVSKHVRSSPTNSVHHRRAVNPNPAPSGNSHSTATGKVK